MAKNQKQPPERRCIFCGNVPLTEEEFWPFWIRKHYPPDNPDAKKHVLTVTGPKLTESKVLTGPKHAKKLKVVCAPCNNEWMSQIEEITKPFLMPLLDDSPIVLNSIELKRVATWASLRAIIAEYVDLSHSCLTKEDLAKFYKRKSTHKNWFVWIGRASEFQIDYEYQSWYGFLESSRVPINPDLAAIESKSTTFSIYMGIKHLVIFVMYNPFIEFYEPLLDELNRKLVKIYPLPPFLFRLIRPIKLRWNKINSITYQNLQELMGAFNAEFGTY